MPTYIHALVYAWLNNVTRTTMNDVIIQPRVRLFVRTFLVCCEYVCMYVQTYRCMLNVDCGHREESRYMA